MVHFLPQVPQEEGGYSLPCSYIGVLHRRSASRLGDALRLPGSRPERCQASSVLGTSLGDRPGRKGHADPHHLWAQDHRHHYGVVHCHRLLVPRPWPRTGGGLFRKVDRFPHQPCWGGVHFLPGHTAGADRRGYAAPTGGRVDSRPWGNRPGAVGNSRLSGCVRGPFSFWGGWGCRD